MKRQLLTIFFITLIIDGYSQDSLKIKSENIGLSSTLLNNISFIDWGDKHEHINSVEHKLDLGYSVGISYLYRYKKMFFELSFQYTQENDKFKNIPITTFKGYSTGSGMTIIESLDYENKMNLYLRYSSLSWLLKFNLQPVVTKHFTIGAGLGIVPCIINSEKIYNFQTNDFEKPFSDRNHSDIQVKAVGSLNFIYFPTKKIFVKTAPTAIFSLIKRDILGYNIRPFNIGLDIGIFYKIK